MPIPEKLLNDNGIFIKQLSTDPNKKEGWFDWIIVNGKEYQTSYASYNDKTLTIWDGDEIVNDKILAEINCL